MFGKTENHRDIVASIAEEYESSAGHKNMLQLIHLRWLAVFGQIATIALVVGGFGIRLPVLSMAFVLAVLIAFNIASHLRWHEETKVSNRALFLHCWSMSLF
jgi:two-component system sensor histidine kinase RegB